MKKIVAMALLLMIFAAPLLYRVLHEPPAQHVRAVGCGDLVRGCRIELASQPVEVRFSEPPSALKAFELLVTAPRATQVHASFAMVGMDMGLNRYDFVPAGNGLWRARVVLPMCVTGRRDWVMTLTLDQDSVQIPFSAGR